jgi:hypothetical protein
MFKEFTISDKVYKGSKRRTSRASLSVELACGSFFMVLFVLLGLHLGIGIFGAYVNDRACRDACRNAAQGKDLTESTKLATTVIKGYRDSSFLSAPKISSPLVYQDFGGKPPAQTSPFVQVSTETQVTLPFGVLAFFNTAFLKDGKIAFRKSYTFPIVRIK